MPGVSTVLIELVSRSHHVEEDEPDADGVVAWRGEYDLLELSAPSGLVATVRTYTDEPNEAALLRFERDGRGVDLGKSTAAIWMRWRPSRRSFDGRAWTP